MNGVGVGTAVGFGVLIGLGIADPGVQVIEYVATFAFYGLLSGFVFHLYQMALKDWKPFGSKRP
jgi:hypothetical protein